MSVLRGAKVVVTGGAGNVGSHIVDAAIARMRPLERDG